MSKKKPESEERGDKKFDSLPGISEKSSQEAGNLRRSSW